MQHQNSTFYWLENTNVSVTPAREMVIIGLNMFKIVYGGTGLTTTVTNLVWWFYDGFTRLAHMR